MLFNSLRPSAAMSTAALGLRKIRRNKQNNEIQEPFGISSMLQAASPDFPFSILPSSQVPDRIPFSAPTTFSQMAPASAQIPKPKWVEDKTLMKFVNNLLVNAYIHIHTHAYEYVYMVTWIHICIYTCMSYICCMNVCMHAYMYVKLSGNV